MCDKTTIKLYFVSETIVQKALKVGEGNDVITVVPENIMMLHQLITVSPGDIFYRSVSCVCSPNYRCGCFGVKTHIFQFGQEESFSVTASATVSQSQDFNFTIDDWSDPKLLDSIVALCMMAKHILVLLRT